MVIIIRLYLRLRISFVVNSSTIKQVYGDPILTADVINISISYSNTKVVIHTGVKENQNSGSRLLDWI